MRRQQYYSFIAFMWMAVTSSSLTILIIWASWCHGVGRGVQLGAEQ
jgi:hypothetical protein